MAQITNDGDTVVFRERNTPASRSGLKIVRRTEQETHEVGVFDRFELTGMKPPERHSMPQNLQEMRKGTSYLYIEALMEFILDDEQLYAIWFGQTDRWLLVSLRDFKQTIVRDAKTLDRLNSIAYRKAEELVLEHQPTPLRRLITLAKEQLAKFLPSFRIPPFRAYMKAETTTAYLFLTARGAPADRHFIEGLLNYTPQGTHDAFASMNDELRIDYSVTHTERLIGDFLLSRWDGETNREFFSRESHLLIPLDSYRYLGSIKIDFELPGKIPGTNAGVLWAYVIPAALPQGKWKQSRDALALSCHFDWLPFQEPPEPGTEGRAKIYGITPGDYRVKMVWQRHPLAGIRQTSAYTAIPGDYETPESETIHVNAGENRTVVPLACTNRLGDPKAYAADDRLWEKRRSSAPKPQK